MIESNKLLLDFLLRPEHYWGGNLRQLKKTKSRFEEIKSFYGWATPGLVDFITSISIERVFNKTETMYLPSFGSSGSHLLQHVLHKSYGMISLGEIYLPPRLSLILNEDLNSDQKNIFIESFHLIHGHPKNIFLNKEIVNTAHYPDLNSYKYLTRNFRKGLILRSPIDVVISRTFRKAEYREYLGKSEVSDFDYLKENVDRAKKFYALALKYNFDKYFFYEDLISDTYKASTDIVDFVGKGDRGVVEKELNKAVYEGASNKYSGPKVQVPNECLEYARTELSEICGKIDTLKNS